MAEGIVKQIIQLIGLDQASGTVAKVKGEVADMHHANGEGFKLAAERSGDLEKGLLGVRDLVGNLPAPVQKVADAFGGAEKILQIMPGPIGMIGAGLAVAGASAYILWKNISETQAKMNLLGGERTFAFREKLDLAVNDAIKLTQAIDKLPKALQPTDRELQTVADRAKSMGLEGKDAVLGYVDALKEGPQKLIEFEQGFGRLGKAAISLPAIDKQLGLNTKAIDLATTQIAALDKAKQLRADAETAQIRANALADQFNSYQEQYAKSSRAAREENIGTVRALQDQASVAKDLADQKKAEYEQARAALELEQLKDKTAKNFATVNQVATAEIARKESEVALISDKQRQSKAAQTVLGIKLADIERQRLAIQDQLQKKIIDEQAAKIAIANLDTQQNNLVAQNQQAQREKAAAAADKAKSMRLAELQAVAKLAQVQADANAANNADEQEVYLQRIDAINKQQEADIKAAQAEQATAKAKEAKITVIKIEAEAKRKKVRDDITDVEAQREKESIDGAKRVADLIIETEDAIRKSRIAAATDPAAKYDLVIADLRIQSERKIKEVKDNAMIAEELRSARIQSLSKETAAAIAQAEKDKVQAIKEGAHKAMEQTQKTIDQTSDIIENASSVVAAYQGKNGIGTALVETAKQVKAVSAGWVDSKNKTGDVIGAVGNVAAAFVDGEREKAGVLALMETAAAAVAIATGDIPGAIAHGTAAALYGSVAGGLIGGKASAAPAATGGGGFAATAAGGGGGGGAAGATVINFNAPLGTAYEIGKSVVKAQKAAGASGWSPNMAMGV